MNILVVSHFQSDKSPCAIFVHNQIKSFIANGHKVYALVPIPVWKKDYNFRRVSPIIYRKTIEGIEYIFLRYFSFSKFGEKGINTRNAIRVLRRNRKKIFEHFIPDIIHAHTLGFDGEIGKYLKKCIMRPLVLTVHGSDLSIPFQRGEISKINEWCKNVDAVVCVSNRLADELKSCGVLNDIYTIHNGFNDNFLIKCNKQRHSIIQVSNLVPSKRVDNTIRAFHNIVGKYPDARLTIIGDGLQKEYLKDLCMKLHLQNEVIFLGAMDNKQVIENLCRNTVFVMVSSPEGFGIVYLEAMASGCITIGTENEGISDIITHGENGFLLPKDDIIAISDNLSWVFENQTEANSIAENGKKLAMHYTWNENVKKYINLFELLKGTEQ